MGTNVSSFIPMIILAVFFGLLLIVFFIEGIRQKKIISIRNHILKSNCLQRKDNNVEEYLVVSEKILLQENEGHDPQDRKSPRIRVRSYGAECEIVSSKKGIWCEDE